MLLVLLQPDLGSALTFIPVALVGLFLGGLRPKWIVLFAILSVLVPILGWYNLKVYQKERIYTFLEPERDPLGAGYHSIQSKIAVGSGGLWGKGIGKGSQTRLGFLPERHTDFIFSVVGEELGFVGAVTLLSFYFFIITRSIHIAITARDKLGIYVVLGAISVILFHVHSQYRDGGWLYANYRYPLAFAQLWRIFDLVRLFSWVLSSMSGCEDTFTRCFF